jgi:DNA polymerase-3 subunit epsilon
MQTPERFAALDVETPNAANDRISAIGVVVLDRGEISDRFYTLVDPQTHFDAFNIRLTGITPRMVRGCPDFGTLWPTLRPYLEQGILAAHNAPFDLGVLASCLRSYGIDWKPEVEYLCTCRMGRKLLPELPDHRLDTMAAHFRLPLDHHNAASDTLVCAQLLQRYLLSGADPMDYVRRYDLQKHRR